MIRAADSPGLAVLRETDRGTVDERLRALRAGGEEADPAAALAGKPRRRRISSTFADTTVSTSRCPFNIGIGRRAPFKAISEFQFI